jgi:quercetin dioxygenase-like cupin family protein
VSHREPTDEVVEQAALHTLGALEPDERTAFEAHLAAGCGPCAEAQAGFAIAARALDLAPIPVAPRPELRARLLATVAATATGDLGVIARADDGAWETLVAGIVRRPLGDDPVRGRFTELVRLDPGVMFPVHGTADTEEMYVLDGDLIIAGERLGVGDYCATTLALGRAEATTAGGCRFVRVAAPPAGPGPGGPGRPAVIVRATEGEWRSAGAAGVHFRRLLADRRHGTVTGVVRIEAGARVPAHRHVTTEQLYILEGEAVVGSARLRVGDFYRTDAGTSHDVTHSERGCRYLLIASAVEMLDVTA